MLMSTDHGTMIVNRNDYKLTGEKEGYGVGFQLMNGSSYEGAEVDFALWLLRGRQADRGMGVIGIDCGANIGVHTIEWGRAMFGWGHVYSFEPQEPLFYALAGNIAINNCLNVTARLAAVGESCGTIGVPFVDYCVPSSFGSLELAPTSAEFIGQPVDHGRPARHVQMLTLDSLELPRVDLVKIDIEGMEMQALRGGAETLRRCKPALIIEIVKTDQKVLVPFLDQANYTTFPMGKNILAIHESDPVASRLRT